MTEKLKPCPFCGSEAVTSRSGGPIPWEIGCKDHNCLGFLPMMSFEREAEAIDAWNTRPAPAIDPEVVKWVREFVDTDQILLDRAVPVLKSDLRALLKAVEG